MAAADGRGENVRVAVLGTGIMGSAMARNLVSAGLRTAVWDRSPTATAPLSGAGALAAASAAEAVRDAHVVITMLPTADVTNSVIFAGGVAQALADGAVWAQMGTIGVTATTEIGGRPRAMMSCRCWPRYPASGAQPLTPATAGKTSAPPAWRSAAASRQLPARSPAGTRNLAALVAGRGQSSRMVTPLRPSETGVGPDISQGYFP